jgi:cbb3-type cytochrome oxidase maturation protein
MRCASLACPRKGIDMEGMFVLIPIALFMGFIGLLAFLWNLKNKQYDDPKGAAMRILNDDDFPLP